MESGHALSLSFASPVWRPQRILVLEGEGVVALSSLCILIELMGEIVREEKRDPHVRSSASSPLFEPVTKSDLDSEALYRPCHYFDYICGSSVGGATAIMLGTMRFTVDETIQRMRKIVKPFILLQPTPKFHLKLGPSRSKNTTRAAQYLQDTLVQPSLGRDGSNGRPKHDSNSEPATLGHGNPYTCQTFFWTARKVRKGVVRPFVFRSYDDGHQLNTSNVAIVQAALASMSTSLLFDSVKMSINGSDFSFRDAKSTGIHPATEAIRECHQARSTSMNSVACLLCVGTSVSPSSPRTKTREKNYDLELEHERFPFARFTPWSLDGLLSEDDHNDLDISSIEEEAKRYCQRPDVRRSLQEWARRMVSYRRDRAETIFWDKYAGLKIKRETSFSSLASSGGSDAPTTSGV